MKKIKTEIVKGYKLENFLNNIQKKNKIISILSVETGYRVIYKSKWWVIKENE